MKKVRFLSALLALILCSSMLLTACGKQNDEEEENETDVEEVVEEATDGESEEVTYKLVDVMNKNWSLGTNKVVSSAAAFSIVGNYSDSDEIFVVATSTDDKNNNVTNIYNSITDKLVLTTTSSKTPMGEKSVGAYVRTYEALSEYYFSAISKNYFAVLNVTVVEGKASNNRNNDNADRVGNSRDFGCALYAFAASAEDLSYAKYTLTIYDADGKAVKTIGEKEFQNIFSSLNKFDDTYANIIEDYVTKQFTSVVADLSVDGTKVYRHENDGSIVLVKDFGVSKMPNMADKETFFRVGDYWVEIVKEYNDTVYIIYNKELNIEYKYILLQYSMPICLEILSNGSLLAQYAVALNQDDAEFDIKYGATGKYDLKTFLVNKDGETELENVNFVISDVTVSATQSNGQKMYSDKVENLALITPIDENKLCDMSASNSKLVVLSNDCKTVTEVVCNEKVVGFPKYITSDVFAVEVAGGGFAIYNKNGERLNEITKAVLEKITKDVNYICIEKDAIYDLKGAKLYDLKKNNATVEVCGNSFVITTALRDENGVEKTGYVLFADGEAKAISGEVVGVETVGYYIVKNNNNGVINYSYYNEKGVAIGTYSDQLNDLIYYASGDRKTTFLLMQSISENKLYKFVFAVEVAE